MGNGVEVGVEVGVRGCFVHDQRKRTCWHLPGGKFTNRILTGHGSMIAQYWRVDARRSTCWQRSQPPHVTTFTTRGQIIHAGAVILLSFNRSMSCPAPASHRVCVCVGACMSLCVVNRWVGQNSFHPPGDERSEFYTHTNNKVLITMAGLKTVVKVGRLAARREGPFHNSAFKINC